MAQEGLCEQDWRYVRCALGGRAGPRGAAGDGLASDCRDIGGWEWFTRNRTASTRVRERDRVGYVVARGTSHAILNTGSLQDVCEAEPAQLASQ